MSWRRWVLAALCLAAFALRVHHLGYESLWLDEADALRLASAPLGELFSRLTSVGENGPLYFILLRGWVTLAGTSEFALRFLSLIASVLSVAVMGALGARLGGWPLGLATAALATCSSFLIFYSQETKMYAILVLLSVLSGYLLVRAFADNRLLLWFAFLVTTSLAMYTHVFGALLIPAALVYAAARPHDLRRCWKGFGAAFALLTVPYLPLAAWQLWALTLPRPPVGSYYGAPAFPDLIRLLLRGFGTIMPEIDHATAWLVFGGLAAIGLLPFGRRDTAYRQRLSYLGAYFLAPAVLAALLFSRMPIFLERYLSPLLPAVFLATAGSVVVLGARWRPLAVAPLAIWVAFNAPPWYDTHIRGILLKEAWRPATQFIESRLEEGDLLIFLSPDGRIAYDYYATKPYRRAETIDIVGQSREQIAAALHARTAGARRYWVVLSQYVREDVDDLTFWLVRNATKVDERGFKNILLSLWLPAPPGRWEPTPSESTAIEIDGRLSLVGYDIADLADGTVSPRCTPEPVLCTVKLTLYWRAGSKLDRDVRISTKLRDDARLVWGQFDLAPNPFYPLAEWRPGAIYRAEWYIPLLPGTPPGRYQLLLSAYDAETGRMLPLHHAGDAAPRPETVIGELTIRPPTGGWPARAVPAGPAGRFGPVELLGSAIGPSETTLGGTLTLTTFWAGDRPAAEAVIELTDGGASWSVAIPAGADVRAVQARLPLPAATPPGEYHARLRLRIEGRAAPLAGPLPFLTTDALSLGTVVVRGRAARYEIPAAARRVEGHYDGGPTLVGYTLAQRVNGAERPLVGALDREADALVVTLYWRSAGPTAAPYSVFAHLVGESETPLAQHDGPPGEVPTTAWLRDEIVADRHEIPLERLAPGRYRLAVGLYDPATLARLPTPDGTGRTIVASIEK
ncbi:MAG: glycosyltransferase family 39 protein [Chloroflexota bacterium]|nr:glycosyltransferase family 39 protein [Dehalococcoidia bacterium]MDW8254748.1 glycosyltransferase family 39 protein [Chloroflexota bacterium]